MMQELKCRHLPAKLFLLGDIQMRYEQMMCSSIHTHRFLLGPPETSVCLCLFPHVLCSLCSEGGRGLHSCVCVCVCVCVRARVRACVCLFPHASCSLCSEGGRGLHSACVTSQSIRREKQGYRVTESNFF